MSEPRSSRPRTTATAPSGYWSSSHQPLQHMEIIEDTTFTPAKGIGDDHPSVQINSRTSHVLGGKDDSRCYKRQLQRLTRWEGGGDTVEALKQQLRQREEDVRHSVSVGHAILEDLKRAKQQQQHSQKAEVKKVRALRKSFEKAAQGWFNLAEQAIECKAAVVAESRATELLSLRASNAALREQLKTGFETMEKERAAQMSAETETLHALAEETSKLRAEMQAAQALQGDKRAALQRLETDLADVRTDRDRLVATLEGLAASVRRMFPDAPSAARPGASALDILEEVAAKPPPPPPPPPTAPSPALLEANEALAEQLRVTSKELQVARAEVAAKRVAAAAAAAAVPPEHRYPDKEQLEKELAGLRQDNEALRKELEAARKGKGGRKRSPSSSASSCSSSSGSGASSTRLCVEEVPTPLSPPPPTPPPSHSLRLVLQEQLAAARSDLDTFFHAHAPRSATPSPATTTSRRAAAAAPSEAGSRMTPPMPAPAPTPVAYYRQSPGAAAYAVTRNR